MGDQGRRIGELANQMAKIFGQLNQEHKWGRGEQAEDNIWLKGTVILSIIEEG